MRAPPRSRLLASASLLALVALVGCAAACTSAPVATRDAPDPDAPVGAPWQELRAQPAPLLTRGEAPAAHTPLALPQLPDVVFERAHIAGPEGALLAVLARPITGPLTPDTPPERLPGIVLFHGGFALTEDQLAWAALAVRAGFIALMPTLRGENGNTGAYELLRGEVEDARAAIRFLAQEPDVDADALVAFGHSVGGGLASLLAVEGDVPLKLIASAGGIYAPSTFMRWRKEDPARVPFDTNDKTLASEAQVRALLPFVHQLALPLVLYVGRDDAWSVAHARTAEARARAASAPLEVVMVDGDHQSAVLPALALVLARAASADVTDEPVLPVPVAAVGRSRAR